MLTLQLHAQPDLLLPHGYVYLYVRPRRPPLSYFLIARGGNAVTNNAREISLFVTLARERECDAYIRTRT